MAKPTIIEFDGVMEFIPSAPNSGAIPFPFDMVECFGKKSVKVKITCDGIEYRGLLKSMGNGPFCLFRKDIRQKLGKGPGDTVHVTVQKDTEERVVEVPSELKERLEASPQAKAFFEKLSYTGRKEYARWVASAKREDTKLRRLEKSVEFLLAGKKSPT